MEDATSANVIIERLKTGTQAKSDTELAYKLGVGQQSVSNARKSGKLPDSWIRKAAESFNLSADWLLFGEGVMIRGSSAEQTEQINLELTPAYINMQDRIEQLEKELAAAKEGEKAALEEALRAYRLATQNMQSETEVLQYDTPGTPKSVDIENTKKGSDKPSEPR